MTTNPTLIDNNKVAARIGVCNQLEGVVYKVPTYEYECSICHFRFERRQGFDEEPQACCPRCQGKTHRLLHPVPVIFKGSGFYITDHRKDEQPEYQPDKALPSEKDNGGKK